MNKSYDPGSVYGYDPETGIARERPEPARPRERWRKCAGCSEPIEPGQECQVTVQAGKHVTTVLAHDGHREAARANTLEDKSWQGSSHYAG